MEHSFSTYNIVHYKLPSIYCNVLLRPPRTKAIIPQLLEALVTDSSQLSPTSRAALSQSLPWRPPTSNNWSVGQWKDIEDQSLCLSLEQPFRSIPGQEFLMEPTEVFAVTAFRVQLLCLLSPTSFASHRHWFHKYSPTNFLHTHLHLSLCWEELT